MRKTGGASEKEGLGLRVTMRDRKGSKEEPARERRRIVLDTDVLIGAVMKPRSYAAKVLRLVREGEVELAVDERILAEYRRILRHFGFRLKPDKAKALVQELSDLARHVEPTTRLQGMPDPDDAPFVEVALASNADAVVTANLRDYPPDKCQGIAVMITRDFIRSLGGTHAEGVEEKRRAASRTRRPRGAAGRGRSQGGPRRGAARRPRAGASRQRPSRSSRGPKSEPRARQ